MELTEVYLKWSNSLEDRTGRARIQGGVARLAHGKPGQHRVATVLNAAKALGVRFHAEVA